MASRSHASVLDCLQHHFQSRGSADKAKEVLDLLPASFDELDAELSHMTEHSIRQKIGILKDVGYITTNYKDFDGVKYTYNHDGVKRYLSKWRKRFYDAYQRED